MQSKTPTHQPGCLKQPSPGKQYALNSMCLNIWPKNNITSIYSFSLVSVWCAPAAYACGGQSLTPCVFLFRLPFFETESGAHHYSETGSQ